MSTLPLPTTCPQWYKPEQAEDPKKGWTPQTHNVINKTENKEIINAWNGTYYPDTTKRATVEIKGLKIISPIQVGGGSFPEGGILPAQVGGVPCIWGSSIRGSFLKFIRTIWNNLAERERAFWLTLADPKLTQWQPRKIRFETIRLKNLSLFPLHAQQNWQIFNEKSKQLSIQWQVTPKHPPNPSSADKFSLQVIVRNALTPEQKQWLQERLTELLKIQGIGRGTRSGFGRLATSIPLGAWEIELTGMKPCIQPKIDQENQRGLYRWSPQVLRANLRGYFTRLALALMSKDDAIALTKIIWGGLKNIAQITLTSYLHSIQKTYGGGQNEGYKNILAKDAHETWIIKADCTPEFKSLVGRLLELSSRLGGLGPGWRRPPHSFGKGLFRGSQFKVNTDYSNDSLEKIIEDLSIAIKDLAQHWKLKTFKSPQQQAGTIVSIWQGKTDQWRQIVHNVCSSSNNNRPSWCGNSQERPSGYAVREYNSYCLISVFEKAVEGTLRERGFNQIWVI